MIKDHLRIVKLVDDFEKAGTRSIEWDGKNNEGKSVCTGIYFYRFKAGDYVQNRKMIFLK